MHFLINTVELVDFVTARALYLHADVFRELDPSDASQVAVSAALSDPDANVPDDTVSWCYLRKVPRPQRPPQSRLRRMRQLLRQ
jgi:hypothetical protein